MIQLFLFCLLLLATPILLTAPIYNSLIRFIALKFNWLFAKKFLNDFSEFFLFTRLFV